MISIKHAEYMVLGVSSRLNFASILLKNKPYTTKARKLWEDKQEDRLPQGRVKWFYATDVPLTKPVWFNYTKTTSASKFIPFSDYDSARIEKQYLEYYNRTEDNVSHVIEVNEDKLFQVDLKHFELLPVYWEGPTYEVRRGTWFSVDGVPLAPNLAQQLELAYQSKKPYLFEDNPDTNNKDLSKDALAEINKFNDIEPGEVAEDDLLKKELESDNLDDLVILDDSKAVIFYDADTAVLFPSEMINSFQLSVIRRFGASSGPLINVQRIKRGFDPAMTKSIFDSLPDNAFPQFGDLIPTEAANLFSAKEEAAEKTKDEGSDQKENKQMKATLEQDFDQSTDSKSSDRQIDHLVLCIHGIGQVLGSKYESIYFTHSCNVLRNTMKDVYKKNNKFQKLAYPEGSDKSQIESNNRVQVLPISWRHKVDFSPTLPFEEDRGKQDPRLPTLTQITVDGVTALRNVLGDVALDILLYYELRYRQQILDAVTEELNRVYNLYVEHNPDFKGKVHILGHSLGSAIAFDIACAQYNKLPAKPDLSKDLTFDPHSLYLIGCPVGVFKLLSRKNLVARAELPENFDPRDETHQFSSPKCRNIYNLYHPCDPVGYRLEPLIKPRYSRFKAEEAPFAVEGFNTQIKGLSSLSEDIQEKLSQATGWFLKSNRKKDVKGKVFEENALGDIVKSIVKSEEDEDTSTKKSIRMSEMDVKCLTKYNRGARVDYCLPMGMFDISLVSAISAHVSYFEDQDTAGFVLGELLEADKPPVEWKEVIYVQEET